MNNQLRISGRLKCDLLYDLLQKKNYNKKNGITITQEKKKEGKKRVYNLYKNIEKLFSEMTPPTNYKFCLI